MKNGVDDHEQQFILSQLIHTVDEYGIPFTGIRT